MITPGIKLYDTMQRKKVEFAPADPKRITMYVCGPTVYGRAHIGNARPAVVFDTLARLIRHQYGPDSLVYARNVTDVDDKIIAAAEAEGVDPSVITQRYEDYYLEDMGALGVAPPTIAPHATQEIGPMIAMIETLIAKKCAYVAEEHVLFSVASDPDYGALSHRDREAMVAGSRVEIAPYKRDAADFVLWKPSKPGVIGWESDWGRGRPGWHIECSAMIRAHLGETIDIHGGGLDLIFPHHENELAQSRCAHGGAPLARHWVHNGFVDMGAEKMSKSLGNVVGVDGLLAAGHRGEALRLALLQSHYRSPLPWTIAVIEKSKRTLDGFYRRIGSLEPGNPSPAFVSAMSDDLNIPKAIAELHQIDDAATLKASANLLGLLTKTREIWEKHLVSQSVGMAIETSEAFALPADVTLNFNTTVADSVTAEVMRGSPFVDAKIAERNVAKSSRDFATADRIRDELAAEGILLEDGPNGTTWRRA